MLRQAVSVPGSQSAARVAAPAAASPAGPSASTSGSIKSTGGAATASRPAGAAAAGGALYATGLFDFESDQPDDLPFKQGDVIKARMPLARSSRARTRTT